MKLVSSLPPLTSLFLTPPASAEDEEQDTTPLGVGESMGLPSLPPWA